jgi:hypothetical protein
MPAAGKRSGIGLPNVKQNIKIMSEDMSFNPVVEAARESRERRRM